jgi:hypothetical protein
MGSSVQETTDDAHEPMSGMARCWLDLILKNRFNLRLGALLEKQSRLVRISL